MKRFKLNIQQFAEPGEPKTFTQEEVDEMINKRFARMKADFEKEKKSLKENIMNLLKIMRKELKMLILLQKKSTKKRLIKFKKI